MRRILAPLLVLLITAGALPSRARADDGVPGAAREACDALRGGDEQTALDRSLAATESHAELGLVWRVRGYVLSRTGDRMGAMGAYVRALRLDPEDCVAQNNLGTLLLQTGDYDEALESFDKALALCPTYADAANNRGVALERLGEARRAAEAYEDAIQIDPKHATAHNNLGAAELRRGNPEAAQQAFEQAAAIDPTFAAPSLNLALLRDPALEGAAYDRLLEAAAASGASEALRARALLAQAARAATESAFEEARGFYGEALELTPNDPALLNNLAVVEDQLGLDRFALAHLTEALRLRPGMSVARNNLGIVHVHRGDATRAEETFREVIRDDPEFHRAYYNLGVLMASQGRIDDARWAMRSAWRLAPYDGSIRYNLGLIARESGRGPARERRAYEEAIELDDALPEAHLSLGALLADPATPASLRDPASARRHLTRFLELTPDEDTKGRERAEAWLRYLDFKAGAGGS